MYKQIVGYIPANVVPAVVSFVIVYAYTRILTPSSFGTYNFVFSLVLFVQMSIYDVIPMAIMRFYPAADVLARKTAFLKDASVLFFAIT